MLQTHPWTLWNMPKNLKNSRENNTAIRKREANQRTEREENQKPEKLCRKKRRRNEARRMPDCAILKTRRRFSKQDWKKPKSRKRKKAKRRAVGRKSENPPDPGTKKLKTTRKSGVPKNREREANRSVRRSSASNDRCEKRKAKK